MSAKHVAPTRKTPKPSGIATRVAIFAIAIGVVLLVYPSIVGAMNGRAQAQDVAAYEQTAAQMDDARVKEALDEAAAYNDSLPAGVALSDTSAGDTGAYDALLDPSETGVMGQLSIPALSLTLPIYHETTDRAMLKGACHMAGTALPIGEPSTHAGITAHRGEPGASYFKDLNKVAMGDTFTVTVLGQETTYEVDRIVVVEPHEVGALSREEGKALCTLITCTPYGVNTHRLLVRGHAVS